MKTLIVSMGMILYILAGLLGCSGSNRHILPPENLASIGQQGARAETIRYQDPISWPKWQWWKNLTSTNPKRWDVVVFRQNPEKSELRALRVVGLPGETIRFEQRSIMVDDRSVEIPEVFKNASYAPGAYQVPKEHYFLLSDDPNQLNDSRLIGAVPREAIISRIDRVRSIK